MQKNDVELIHRILDGDDAAFTELVNKYKKSVHALVWRKIGDFHIAEEITQDTFLKAYQKLSTLKRPQRFASWLYVIASRRCLAWQRKKRILMKSLEETSSAQIEKATYSQYVVDENERISAETQRNVVKKLLAKLPESERTIITLHYFSEMSSSEIGAFLGVSANTIRSRLRRAQQRLQKEETMIREALDHFKLSPNLTENIIQEVARLKPAAPSGSKPLVPWIVAASSAVLLVLMLGIGSQQLIRFQNPYSLDAQAEMTVELVDTPIVLNVDVESNVKNQLGNSNSLGINENDGQKPDEVLLAAAEAEVQDKVSQPKQQWIQSAPTVGTMVEGLLATSEGVLYAFSGGHIYRLQDDNAEWQHVSDISTLTNDWLIDFPMAEWDDTLYIAPSNKLLASKDDGKTWNIVYQWPKEYDTPNELLLTEQAFYIIFYQGAFRSEDKGKTWKNINDEFPNKPNYIVTAQDTVFVLTGNIYRWNSGSWQRLAEFPVPQAKSCFSITATKDKLYAFAINAHFDPGKAADGERGWWIFRSTDLGNSWKDITPTHVWKSRAGWLINIKLVAAGDTLLAIEQGIVRSTDGGDTWMPLQAQGVSPTMFSNSPALALNECVFYLGSPDEGLQRSTDSGASWEVVNVTPEMSGINSLIVYKEDDKEQNIPPIIYGSIGDMLKTADQGKSWKTIPTDMPMTTWETEYPPEITQIVKSGGVIYAKGSSSFGLSAYGNKDTRIYRLSTDGNRLVTIQDMPVFDPWIASQLSQREPGMSDEAFVEQLEKRFSGATVFFRQLVEKNQQQQIGLRQSGLQGVFAVSGDTFYMEYNFKLFRWKGGETEWYDTGVEETNELSLNIGRRLQLAVSGDTVYVGKRDGHLLVSYDRGDNWVDLTPALPFRVKAFNDIVVAGSTVYVSTNAGIITSNDGRNWRNVSDTEGENLIMERMTVDGSTFYGVTKETGICRLENGTWNRIVSDIPEKITSLAVDGNIIYVGTENQGMLHINLEE